jgi:choline-sulfatase
MRIMYLDLDTLRPDHLGCYGYHRNTSQCIDAIARNGVLFSDYYCSDAPCLPSRAALMTGMFGFHNGIVGHGGTAADLRLQGSSRSFRSDLSSSSLPAMLKQNNLYTTFIGGFGERHSAWWFYAGFREIHDTGQGGMESAESVTPTVLDWIEKNGRNDNWYLHVNYWDPHTPYRAPHEFGNPFENEPLPSWLTPEVVTEHIRLPGPHTAQDVSMYDNRIDPRFPRQPGEINDMDSLRSLIDGYDTGIRYMDNHIGKLIEALKSIGVYEDLAIIISSDHGENLGELGIYAEHATADYSTCHVPLIIKWPKGESGKVKEGLHYNLDLKSTLVDLLGGDTPCNSDGQSFAQTVLGNDNYSRPYLVMSQCAHVCQRAVRWKTWMYIRTWHDGFHLFPESMLFDLEHDPHEQHDLASSLPAICQQGEKLLAEWTDSMLRSMPAGYTIDPMHTVLAEGGPFHARGMLANYIKRLEQTGRGWAVDPLKNRHPQEFVNEDSST